MAESLLTLVMEPEQPLLNLLPEQIGSYGHASMSKAWKISKLGSIQLRGRR
jgi:hypothetical protein